jgi:Rad52/22 family double-strand break repair protein
MSYDRHVIELARPFPQKFIEDDGRGNAYVGHDIIIQRLIRIFGRPPKIELLREIYDDTDKGRVLSGVVMRMTVPGFEPVEEAGDAENPQAKTNGAKLKTACSDAVKRCAMRLGLGLHLWSQEHYYLYEAMLNETNEESGESHASSGSAASGEPQGRATSASEGGSSPQQQSESGGGSVPRATSPAADSTDVPACDVCGGEMWDNRPDKASGKRKPTFPDFKCKDKACNNAKWVVSQ